MKSTNPGSISLILIGAPPIESKSEGISDAIIDMFFVRSSTRKDDIENNIGAPKPMAMKMKRTYIKTLALISFRTISWSKKIV